jgi:hypothetical protein
LCYLENPHHPSFVFSSYSSSPRLNTLSIHFREKEKEEDEEDGKNEEK